jgi:hypothetical protein
MKNVLAAALLAAGAEALVPRDQTCCFHLTADGGPGGPVDQLYDGQNRIGQSGLPEGSYCIDSNGGLTDGEGRGCILTPPTTQFQCDVGATPTPGFAVGCNGGVTYQGSDHFIACPTGDNGGYNIYTEPVDGQSKCVDITLMADSCKSNCPSKPPPSTGSCPTDITNGNYEYPHLIVPINSDQPDKAYGTSYNGQISSTTSTIFNFDIPKEDEGKKCTFIFRLPKKSDLETSSYTYGGSGGIDFSMLSAPATEDTTYNDAPSVKQDYGTTDVQPGGAYDIATMDCPAGQTIAFEAKSSGTNLDYFQDYNPSAIGAYVTVC